MNRRASEKPLSDWVQKALEVSKMSQADLSRALIQSGLRTIDRSAVNKIVLGTRKVSGEEMLEISRITGHPIPDRRIGASKVRQEELPPASAPAPQTATVVAPFERSLVANPKNGELEKAGSDPVDRSAASAAFVGLLRILRPDLEEDLPALVELFEALSLMPPDSHSTEPLEVQMFLRAQLPARRFAPKQ